MNFDNFDDSIGVDGYYKIIRSKFFPNESPDSFNIAGFHAEEQIFRKGTVFSRVRKLNNHEVNEFLNGNIKNSDFFPPQPDKVEVKEGRFNAKNNVVLYVADHPYVAINECEVKCGDYFLLSFLSLQKDMCFLHIHEGKDELSSILYSLFKANDKRFYPVINLIYSNLLSFDKYHGIAYDSVKVPIGYKNSKFGTVESVTNIAISSDNIKDIRLEASWLEFYGRDDVIFEHAIFIPLSKKKNKKIRKIFYSENKDVFIETSNCIKSEMNLKKDRNKILLDKGCVNEFNKPPMLFVKKDNPVI
ncbi:TPA: hypothetical protein ACX6TX_004327 [Yersinia enterocolitica]|uniref:hypothetical protein n=1 Tax=Yersinia enterocolitica TaxID=630 RepID=UPI0005EA32F5|nr:hypothetical protein [Yersinia enterocolitica]EKN4024283.1 hypothetical protein [Yersinia enterocolitica]EKN4025426.1 hypothetical protein [Yersinia enterocolitica]UYK19936.1 hypothetical protein N4220_06105 [Yersinia enterocolitica]CQH49948.1 Uncharacterised protein [Yersinia enterocolitica]CQJ39104.1 Uncharacterised protein [Yersinia enterocolitica]